MIRMFCFTACVLAWSPMALGETPQLRNSKPVVLPALEKEELVAVPLDSDVYAATQFGLPDLRILDDKNAEVAFITRKATVKRSRTERRQWTVANPTVRPLEDNALEITFELDPQLHDQPDGLRLVSPRANFEHRVQVFSSANGQDWTPLTDDGLIFDYERFMDARNDTIALPATDHRHFRILIENVTDEQQSQLMELTRRFEGDEQSNRSERVTVDRRPFRIDRIELWAEVVRRDVLSERETSYPLANFAVTEDADTKQTIVTLDSRREPLTELTIETADRNFSRAARVEIEEERQGKSTWRPIASGNLSRLDFRTLQRSQLTLSFGESRAARYRIVIENRDSPPLKVTGVTARGHVYEAVFLAAPDRKYRVAYENRSLGAPSYDTAALAASLSEGFEPVAATLGDEVRAKPVPDPGLSRLAQLVNDGRVLTATIAVLVVILGWGLYRATQRLDKLPHDMTNDPKN